MPFVPLDAFSARMVVFIDTMVSLEPCHNLHGRHPFHLGLRAMDPKATQKTNKTTYISSRQLIIDNLQMMKKKMLERTREKMRRSVSVGYFWLQACDENHWPLGP